jgi:hypothetical protein
MHARRIAGGESFDGDHDEAIAPIVTGRQPRLVPRRLASAQAVNKTLRTAARNCVINPGAVG